MRSRAEKIEALRALATQRRVEGAGTARVGYVRDYRQIEDFHNRFYDVPEWLTPWTKSACNVDSNLMIIGQDWAADSLLLKAPDLSLRDLGYGKKVRTNVNLQELLHKALGFTFADIYATNAFVFVKSGGMNARIPLKDLCKSVEEYALRELEIVRPKLALCLGVSTFKAFRKALKHPSITEKEICARPIYISHLGTEIAAVPHCSPQVINRIGMEKAYEIWSWHAANYQRWALAPD